MFASIDFKIPMEIIDRKLKKENCSYSKLRFSLSMQKYSLLKHRGKRDRANNSSPLRGYYSVCPRVFLNTRVFSPFQRKFRFSRRRAFRSRSPPGNPTKLNSVVGANETDKAVRKYRSRDEHEGLFLFLFFSRSRRMEEANKPVETTTRK